MSMINPDINPVTVDNKDTLHHLIERLPESEIHTARRFLEFLIFMHSEELERELADE